MQVRKTCSLPIAIGLLAISGRCDVLRAQPADAAAETIYSNLGTGKDKYGDAVWVLYGKNNPEYQIATVFGFSPQKAYKVTEIQVAATFFKNIGPGHAIKLILAENTKVSGHNVPGKHLFEQRLTELPGNHCCKLATLYIPSPQGPQLAAGKLYWLELMPSPNSDAGWAWNSTNTRGIQSTSYNGGKSWQDTHVDRHPNGAFAVYGTPTN